MFNVVTGPHTAIFEFLEDEVSYVLNFTPRADDRVAFVAVRVRDGEAAEACGQGIATNDEFLGELWKAWSDLPEDTFECMVDLWCFKDSRTLPFT